MLDFIKFFPAFLYFVTVAAVRVVLWVIGWFAVALSLVGGGAYHTPWLFRIWAAIDYGTPMSKEWSRWEKYKWFAWRNPTPGLIGLFKQPVPEDKPNPDDLVRGDPYIDSATRVMEYWPYFEYWHLREIDWKLGKKHYKWFEFRFGWKFVDGNDEFFPTFQLGPRSS